MLGPPGAFRQDVAAALCDAMGSWKVISPGDLFKKEIARKTELGKKIQQCHKEYRYGKFFLSRIRNTQNAVLFNFDHG